MMKCPECFSHEGTYREVEDFNPGSEPEWSYYEYWLCMRCDNTVYSYEDGFEYEDDVHDIMVGRAMNFEHNPDYEFTSGMTSQEVHDKFYKMVVKARGIKND